MTVDQSLLEQIPLSPDEYDLIVSRLDREPNPVELGMFGAMRWTLRVQAYLYLMRDEYPPFSLT
jgi:hypothetical protein